MMKITDYLANQTYQPYQPAPNPTEGSAISKQASAFTQDNSITLTTKEGDKVTISQSFRAAFELMSDTKTTANGSQQTLTTASLQANSFNLHVEGDLSDEELADISKLVNDLYTIATDFFNGDTNKAMDGAAILGSDMGSISDLSASFRQTTSVTTYTSSLMKNYQPLPNLQQPGELTDRLQNIEEYDINKNVSFNEIIKAQWNQISTMLDLLKMELQEENLTVPATPEANSAPLYVTSEMPAVDIPVEESSSIEKAGTENFEKDPKDTGKQMMNQIANTIDHHPRLSPFIVPLATHAIDKAAETAQISDPTKGTEMTANLKNEFLNQFNIWLFS